MKHIITLAALLLAGCGGDPPTAADRSRWEADSRAQSARTSQEYRTYNDAVRRQEKLKQDWIARGRPPSPYQR